MSKIGLLTDSTAYLSSKIAKQHNIRVVPLKVHWGNDEYVDGVDLDIKAFYERLPKDAIFPTTSQPSVQDFLDAYTALAKDHDGILAPLIAASLSGTTNSAETAAGLFSGPPVAVVNTRMTGPGLAMIVEAVAHGLEQGLDLEQGKAFIEQMRAHMDLFFAVDTLEFLHKGGRIGAATRFLGSALNIKPILYVDETGQAGAHSRVRTKGKAVAAIIDLAIEKAEGKPVTIGLCHANDPDLAAEVAERLQQQLDVRHVTIDPLSPVVGTHVGPGAIGIAICQQQYVAGLQ